MNKQKQNKKSTKNAKTTKVTKSSKKSQLTEKELINASLRHHAVFVQALGLLLTIVFIAMLTFTLINAVDKERAAFACVCMLVLYILAMMVALYIESTKIGKQQCKACKHKFVPKFRNIFFGVHVGMTRRLKCPKCGKKTWCKKVWE